MLNKKYVLTAALVVISFLTENNAGAEVKVLSDTIVFSGEFIAPTCVPDALDTAVELNKVSQTAFTGKNTVVATKDFSIGFHECDKGATVHLTASGTKDITDDSAFLNMGSAGHNVAVRLKQKDSDSFMDAKGENAIESTASDDGVATFDFTAQMIQPGDGIPVPGKVNAAITLNASYE